MNYNHCAPGRTKRLQLYFGEGDPSKFYFILPLQKTPLKVPVQSCRKLWGEDWKFTTTTTYTVRPPPHSHPPPPPTLTPLDLELHNDFLENAINSTQFTQFSPHPFNYLVPRIPRLTQGVKFVVQRNHYDFVCFMYKKFRVGTAVVVTVVDSSETNDRMFQIRLTVSLKVSNSLEHHFRLYRQLH